MPVWAVTILAVWGALSPIAWAGVKWATALSRQVHAMAQWFDPDSALGLQHGTIPTQVAELQTGLDDLTRHQQVVSRIAKIEQQLDRDTGGGRGR